MAALPHQHSRPGVKVPATASGVIASCSPEFLLLWSPNLAIAISCKRFQCSVRLIEQLLLLEHTYYQTISKYRLVLRWWETLSMLSSASTLE